MAAFALRDQSERTIEVNRLKLVEILEENREMHIREYHEAVDGYLETATEKLQEGYDKSVVKLQKNLENSKRLLAEIDPSKPLETSDRIVLVESICIDLKVPRNYAKEYDAAIDMANWDVRDTLELSGAEFQCFVRDEWDWTNEFSTTTASYSKHKKA